jgi:hypothetical protein
LARAEASGKLRGLAAPHIRRSVRLRGAIPRRSNLFQDVVAIIHRWEVYGTPSPAALQILRQAADSAGVALATHPDYLAGFLRLEPA